MRRRKGLEPKSSNESLGGKPVPAMDFADMQGTEPMRLIDFDTRRNPTTDVAHGFAGVPAFAGNERRMGVHYIRQSMFHRDAYVAMVRQVHDLLIRFASGEDTPWKQRHPEICLPGYAGLTLDSDPWLLAKTIVNMGFNQMYRATHISLLLVELINLMKLQGMGSISPGIGATIRYTVLNNIFSKIGQISVNASYLKGHVDSMADLTNGSPETGYSVFFPLWMPLMRTYLYDQNYDLSQLDSDAYFPLRSRTDVHPLAGMYTQSGASSAIRHDEKPSFGYGLQADTVVPGYTDVSGNIKGAGWFTDHFLEMLAAEVDQYYALFINNSYAGVNLEVDGNKMASFLASFGFMTEKVGYMDLERMAKGIPSLDLASYAAKNFAFMPGVSPTLRADAGITKILWNPADSSSLLKWEMASIDYLRANTPAEVDTDTELPYLCLVPKPGVSMSRFTEGYEADVLGLTGFGVTRMSLGANDVPSHLARLIRLKMLSYTREVKRYVDRSHVGSFLSHSADDPNVYTYPSLFKMGTFMPMWKTTPLIDPNDMFTNGVHLVLDLKVANPVKGTYEDMAHQIGEFGTVLRGSPVTTAEVRAFSGMAQDMSKFPADVALGNNPFKEFGPWLGAALVFIGDGAGLPAFIQIARNDIIDLVRGHMYDAGGKPNIIPAAPYRRVRPDFSIHPAMGGTAYITATAGFEGTMDAAQAVITLEDVPSTNCPPSVDFGVATQPEVILAPIFTPSLLRPITELSQFGLDSYASSKVNYEEKPNLTIVGVAQGASRGSKPKGVDKLVDKEAGKENRFVKDNLRGQRPVPKMAPVPGSFSRSVDPKGGAGEEREEGGLTSKGVIEAGKKKKGGRPSDVA